MKVFRTAVITCIVLYVGFSLLTGWWPRYGCVDIPIPGHGQTCGIQLGGTMDASLVVLLAVLGIVFLWCLFSSEKASQHSGTVQGAITMEQGDRSNDQRVLTTCSFCGVQSVGAGAAACARCGRPFPAANEVMPVAPKKMRLPFGGWILVAVAGVLVVGLFVNASRGRSSAMPHRQKVEETLSLWPREPADFKGLKFGMSPREAKQAAGLKRCAPHDCVFDVGPITCQATFTDGKLDGILGNFSASEFAQLEEVFVSKYGKPSYVSGDTIQNAFGAMFQQRELSWWGREMRISLDQFARNYHENIPGGGQKYDLTRGRMYVLPEKPAKPPEAKKHILE